MIRQFLLALAVATPVAAIDVTPALAHTPPAAPSARTYTVQPGDALASIARKTGVKLSDLLAVNRLTISSTIHPGRVLTLPAGSPPAPVNPTAPASQGNPAAATTTPYTVKAGDALFMIARQHGISLAALLASNSFLNSTTILPGQVIRIPGTTVVPAPAPTNGPTTTTGTRIDTVVAYLREQVGKPYKFFTSGPDTFDCSGLVVAGYRQIGVTLPHQSRMQSALGTQVDWLTEPIKAGDLIFTVSSVDTTQIGHVGIALDANTWIQAAGTGIPVRIRPIPSSDKISGVRRVIDP